ncbi:MAG: SRPBCC domain-containing protein [Pyrinomonadaceae bacterium]
MELKFQVQTKIQKPVEMVFDAVYDPRKLERYFTTKRASAPLDPGTTVIWEWDYWPTAYEVHVKEMIKDELIVFEWLSNDGDTMTRVEMRFEPVGENETMVSIRESGWNEDEIGLKNSYDNCAGWTQMSCSLKAYLEYDINLTKGFY